MKVLGVSASPRPDGNTDTLVRRSLLGCRKHGAETKFVSLRDLEISPCAGHSNCKDTTKCAFSDDFLPLCAEFLSADAVILATPVYYWNMSAHLKTFIDRNYFNYTHDKHMQAKAAGIIIVAASSGFEETEQAVKSFLLRSGQFKAPAENVRVLRALASKPTDAANSAELLKASELLGEDLARLCQIC